MTEAQVASWGRPGGDCVYRLVNDADVDRDVVAAAKAGREFACAHLGIRAPSIGFFLPETSSFRAYRARYRVDVTGRKSDWLAFKGPKGRAGHADRTTHTIGIRSASEDLWFVAEVSAHETFHLAQPGLDVQAEEDDAEAYGVWAADILVRQGMLATVHLHDGLPYRTHSLAGADQWDVMIANEGDKASVFINFGYGPRPRWERYHATCPVEPVRRAA